MEEQLFKWDGWDQYDTMCFGFYDVETKVRLGPVPPGSHFASASIDYTTGVMELFEGDEIDPSYRFQLSFTVESL